HADVVDVAVVLGDDLGDLGQRPRLVHGLEHDARGKALRRAVLHVPAQIEPALGRILEILERRRLDRVDGNALAGREDADDAVARHRSAIGCEAHRQVGVDAPDRDCSAGLAGHLHFDRLGFFQPEPAALRLRLLRDGGGALLLVVGVHGAYDVGSAHLAATDRRHHLLDRGPRQPRQRALQLLVGTDACRALAEPLHEAATEAGILVAHGGAGGPADSGARLAGGDQRFPGCRRRALRPGGDDFDLVAVGELRDQGRDLAVDLAADRHVADIGVHRIGEIDGVRPARQRDQLAFRREAKHLVVEQLELGVLEELLRVGALGEQLDGAAQPRIGAGLARQHLRWRAHAILVERVRGDAIFRDLVHIPGADLQFNALLARADHRGVNGAIVVLLGRRDVVLEATRDYRPGGVHDAERLVALGQRLHHHAASGNVVKLLEADGFALHLAPDRIGALAPPRYLGGDAAFRQLSRELLLDLGDQADVFRFERVKTPADHRVGFRVELAERQILELLAHLMHAHA